MIRLSQIVASVLLITMVGSAGLCATETTPVTPTKKAQKLAQKGPKIQKKDKTNMGTSFRFDGVSLHGKYQTSPSTVATVENDKVLEDLLGARKNFKDRITADKDRN